MIGTLKKCAGCGEEKQLSEFGQRKKAGKTVWRSRCEPCRKDYSRQHYEANKGDYIGRSVSARLRRRDFIRHIKETTPCADCKGFFRYYMMDFDHREGEDKSFNLSSSARHGRASIQEEIDKCDVVCALCHRERTFRRLVEQGKSEPYKPMSEERLELPLYNGQHMRMRIKDFLARHGIRNKATSRTLMFKAKSLCDKRNIETRIIGQLDKVYPVDILEHCFKAIS